MRLFLCPIIFLTLVSLSSAQELVLIDPAPTELSKVISAKLEDSLSKKVEVMDSAFGIDVFKTLSFDNPFNLAIEDGQRLGVRLGSDFFILLKSESLRRSSFGRPVYFESYVSIFLVESRSGELVEWFYKRSEANEQRESSAELLTEIGDLSAKLIAVSKKRYESERKTPIEFIDVTEGIRMPLPFLRMRPEYTKLASRYSIAATVDVAVTIDTSGNIVDIRIMRWAGFGLEESVVRNIRRMKWRPADKNGKPFTMSILLRYNFKDLENKEPS